MTSQRAQEQPLGLLVAALLLEEHRLVVQDAADQGIARSGGRLAQGQRPLVQQRGLLQAPQ